MLIYFFRIERSSHRDDQFLMVVCVIGSAFAITGQFFSNLVADKDSFQAKFHISGHIILLKLGKNYFL